MLSFNDALANLSNVPFISNILSKDFWTPTVMQNVWSFIWFFVAYVLVFVVIPARILRLNLCDGNLFDNALKSLVISQTCVSLVVYVLSFMRIYNTVTLVLALIVGVMFYQKFKEKIRYRERVNHLIYDFSDIITGQRKLSLILIPAWRRFFDSIANGLKYFIKFFFNKNVVYHLICTFTIGILVLRRMYFALESQSYPTSDVFVHTSWVNFLDAGYIYCDGIYPFSMHNIVSAFSRLTFIDVVTVMRFIGPLNGILCGVMLMMFISRFFKSPAAATITGLVYCLSNFGSGALVDRMFFSLPQEFGMFFIFPTAYFMIRFIEDMDNMDGVTFAMAASMTVSVHFYNAIFAVPLCICMAIPFLFDIIRKKDLLWKMILAVILAAAIALAPFAVGRILGYRWQGSLDWAVSMMSKSDDKSADQQSQEVKQQSSDQNNEEAAEKGSSFVEKSINSFGWMAKAFTAYWGYMVLGFTVLGLLLGLVALLTEQKTGGKVAIGLCLNMVMFNYLLMYPDYFGLPSLVANDRAQGYLAYIAAIMIGVPFGVFWLFFEKKLRPIRWISSIAVVTAMASLIFLTGATYVTSAYFRLTYSSVTENYYKIKNTHRKNTWTIVSTVDELALTRNKGWHYELWEFIFSMEQYEPTRVVQIPTEYVYFIIEKRPLKYADTTFLAQPLELYGRVNAQYAEELMTEQTLRTNRRSAYYTHYDNRRALMSKAYYWAQKYMQYFPDQMREYYEDQNIVIYEIKQNMFALNNFAIDYGYNTKTIDQWLEEHPEAIGKDTQTVSDSDLVVSGTDLTPTTA
ncbi:MAG: hypothetical protein II828_04860 [Clostridia bacterium]|nr:hypothetical protein [Clostridia bacterium]